MKTLPVLLLFATSLAAHDLATTDREALRATSLQHFEAARTASEGMKRNPLAAFFRWLPLTLWLAVIGGVFGFLIFKSENRAAEFAARESTIFLAMLAPIAVHLVVTLLLLTFMGDALRDALKAGKPAIIHVKVDPEATISFRKDALQKRA